MTLELVVEAGTDALAMAMVEAGELVDLWSVEAGELAVEERLFLARVTGIEPAVDGAFLDHGGARPGFITGKDARFRKRLSKKVSIKHCLDDGAWLIVQGLRAAEAEKGARFTTDLRLFGPHLVYRPYGDEVTVGRGIRAAEREAVVTRGRALLARLQCQGGLVLRRPASAAADSVLEAELEGLVALWRRLEPLPGSAERRAGALPVGPSPLARLFWRALELAPARLVVAGDASAAEARRLVEALPEAVRPELEVLSGATTAFAATGVAAALAEAAGREVALPGGGRLIVEETAACVAIDVDSGGRPALEVDLEAAAVLARLVRLRNLGGTIVVDFVDLLGKGPRQRLEAALQRAFKGDPLPVQIYPMSPLGIVQISRARRGGRPLAALARPCSACGGSGRVVA